MLHVVSPSSVRQVNYGATMTMTVLIITACFVKMTSLFPCADASLLDARRYGHKHNLDAPSSMVPLSVGIVATSGTVELCLHRGDAVGTTHYRLIASDQVMRSSVKPKVTDPVRIRVVAGERITSSVSSLTLTEWQAPTTWDGPAVSTAPIPQVTPVPSFALLLACTLTEDHVLDVAIRNFSKMVADPASTDADDAHEWYSIFHENVEETFSSETVSSLLSLADSVLNLNTENVWRADAKSRRGFERLVIALLAPERGTTIGDDVTTGASDDHSNHNERSSSDVNTSTTCTAAATLVRRMGEESLRLLLETRGSAQVPHFWEGVERALRRKVSFDDESEPAHTS
mmetsp:Transcript_25382/g.29510  ORF Transcript_25382/g.29510 Transcript_25382/m.29510 type:complete len:344 (+) Transcript_25382:106-1137(+)